MQKLFLIILAVIFLGGCLVRTYTIEKPRVDTEVSGNQGFLSGTPTPTPKKKKLSDTRRISVLEIEFGPHAPYETKEKEISSFARVDEEEKDFEKVKEKRVFVPVKRVTPKPRYKNYTVRKKDTLQKISNKFYGTTRKWNLIYEANRKAIKRPDKIYPGLKIKIPVLR